MDALLGCTWMRGGESGMDARGTGAKLPLRLSWKLVDLDWKLKSCTMNLPIKEGI
jgi:hypothetical protein